MESEVVGFLYMSNDILFVVFIILRSRKFSLLSCSHSSVKFWMLYMFGSGIYDFNIPVSIFGRLYDGALLKFRTGQMGVFFLCTLTSPFKTGVSGFRFMYLPLFLVPTNNLQPFRVFLRSLWNLAVIFPLLTFYRILVPSSWVISYSRRIGSWPLKMITPCSFKMLGATRIMTQDHFPEDLTSQPQSCDTSLS